MSHLPRMGYIECRAIAAARRAEILRMLLLGFLLAVTCALAMLLASVTPVIGSTFTMPPAPPEQDIVPALWMPSVMWGELTALSNCDSSMAVCP